METVVVDMHCTVRVVAVDGIGINKSTVFNHDIALPTHAGSPYRLASVLKVRVSDSTGL